MPSIQLLSETLINQIAAGEVVERPASVLKELGENALDAGARQIDVRVRGGGIELLSVADDGCGMSREDAMRCLWRHATSKLRDAEGLLAIGTLGFRGEALAAIAAVSHLTLTTAEHSAPVATRLRCVGGTAAEPIDAPPVPGTVVEIADLFFNVPARRKFLRREETELRHLEDALTRLALGHPHAGFSLEVEGRTRLRFIAGSDERERLAQALGAEAHAHLLALEERRLGLRVSGFLASPEFTLSTARGLYTFVNGRYVRDRGLISAVQRALGGSLPPGRQPVAAVFLELEPATVDVNVHPQKTEVRFMDARAVYDAVHAAVSRAIRSAPWQSSTVAPAGEGAAHYALAVERFLNRAQEGSLGEVREAGTTVGFGQARPGVNEAAPPDYFQRLRHLGTLARRFWVLEGPGGTLVVIDGHAALERLHTRALFEGFDGTPEGGRALGGGTVRIPPAEQERLLEARGWLERLGLEVEAFGGDALAVRSVPPLLQSLDLASVLIELASALPPPGTTPSRAAAQEAISLLACRAADLGAREPSAEEVRKLLTELDAAPPEPGVRHPRVVLLELPQLEMVRRADAKLGPLGSAG